ncbi:restriction endonuclease subunit S [Streptomyces sp. NPDC087787]|uniref:restriction endonuclease subunit S n=1 Tax=Streptomyces sp. NPDC087787 TaxID=3365803 RepID=UPI00382F9951
MSEWKKVPLEALLSSTISYGIVQPGSNQAAGVPIVRVKDVRNGKVDDREPLRVSPEIESKYTRTRLQGGEILLTLVGSTGQVAVVSPELAGWNVARAIGVLRPSSEISPRWLQYFLESEDAQQYMREHLNTTVQATLNLKDVRQLPVPLPPRGEREAVVSVLGVLDDKIAVNERIANTLRELGHAFFAQAVAEGAGVEANVKSVSCVLTRGIAPKYSESLDDLLVLNQKCIRGGRVSTAPARRTLREKAKAPKLLLRNDVLVNSTGVGTLGRVARWSSDEAATVDSHITIVRFDEAQVDPVCAGFAMLRAQPEIEAMGEGSTGQTELRRTQLGELEIPLPSKERQRELRPRLDSLEARADQALNESQTLATLRDTLLPQLMSGRLRVKDAEKIVEDAT